MSGRLVILLAVALASLVAATIWLSRASASSVEIVAAVPVAEGVRTGSPVSYRGVQVGLVRRVAFTDSAVVLTLRLDRSDVPLRDTDRIDVRPIGLFGDRSVTIVPSNAAGRAWTPADTLRGMPPDTLAPARQAAARAVLDATLGRLSRPASGDTAP
jgi:ABC-type transporter Mla subunit MlaD